MATDEPQAQFGDYRLVSQLGKGGMAEVFVAQKVLGHGVTRTVALKRILPHVTHDPLFQRYFIDEARICCQLHHLNLVSVNDFGEIGGQFFLEMELVNGPTLDNLSYYHHRFGRTLPPSVVIDIIAQLLAGLDHAHEHIRAHRDIKPANVFLTREGIVKLGDFGVAKAADHGDRTAAHQTRGTCQYMSPEQARGEPDLGAPSDLFAVGLVLHELLTGKRTFSAKTLVELGAEYTRLEPARIEAGLPEDCNHFLEVLNRALAIDVADRFQSASEMRHALLDLKVQYPSLKTLEGMVADYAAAAAAEASKQRSPISAASTAGASKGASSGPTQAPNISEGPAASQSGGMSQSPPQSHPPTPSPASSPPDSRAAYAAQNTAPPVSAGPNEETVLRGQAASSSDRTPLIIAAAIIIIIVGVGAWWMTSGRSDSPQVASAPTAPPAPAAVVTPAPKPISAVQPMAPTAPPEVATEAPTAKPNKPTVKNPPPKTEPKKTGWTAAKACTVNLEPAGTITVNIAQSQASHLQLSSSGLCTTASKVLNQQPFKIKDGVTRGGPLTVRVTTEKQKAAGKPSLRTSVSITRADGSAKTYRDRLRQCSGCDETQALMSSFEREWASAMRWLAG